MKIGEFTNHIQSTFPEHTILLNCQRQAVKKPDEVKIAINVKVDPNISLE